MKLTVFVALKICGGSLLLTWILQFVKLSIHTNGEEILTEIEIAILSIAGILGIISIIKESIQIRKDIRFLNKDKKSKNIKQEFENHQ